MRLGCLNHALLTQQAIRASGLQLAGWVANHIDPHMAVPDDNVATLQQRLAAPLLARVPYAPGATPDELAAGFGPAALETILNK
jgi:dethiobiotin synthetase